ncbi:MAG: hypothetical protein NTU81_01930 [Candidatus Nomurabacteria bacterium]|nr:hypothetical protein [Candidatus Nomurabacteria bacterium]
MKIKFFIFGIFIIGIISMPYFSFAEPQIQVQEGEISVETIPSNPQPYEDVTINISSYATDLNKAIITWQTGGVTVLAGIGKLSYSFKALGPDTASVININIQPVGSVTTINKKIVIVPSEIETMWESVDGYAPPFYKGKILPTVGSFIRVVAIPNTSSIKSGNGSISYTWKKNGEVDQSVSGYNKNSYLFKSDMFDQKNEITVVASAVSGNYSAENTTEVQAYKPKIVFYKKSPTEGVLYNNALDKETFMLEDEMTLVAEPYFMSLKGNKSDFSYNWKINGEDVDTPSRKTELTVRPSSRGGYATINFKVENINELFQTISNELLINL